MNSFGELVTEDKKIANSLNCTFSHLSDYYRKNTIEYRKQTTPKLFCFQPATNKEVFVAIKSLKINKPSGPCSIPARPIKDVMTIIVPHLTMVLI